jgi:flagellar biosynthesis/type III secretory pathway protein FliH
MEGIKEGIKEGMKEGKMEGMKEGKMEGIMEGMKEGKMEGIMEGMKEGKIEGMASLTIRLLLRRFQRLDRALENHVRQLSQEELEALGDDLFDIPNEASLAEWLDRRRKSH